MLSVSLYGGSLGSGLAGEDEIKALQKALTQVSVLTGQMRLNPLETDGKVGGGTVAALFNAASAVSGMMDVPGLGQLVNFVKGLPLVDKITNPPLAKLAWYALPSDSKSWLTKKVDELATRAKTTIQSVIEQTSGGSGLPGSGSNVPGGAGSSIPGSITVNSFPAGSVARYNKTRKNFSIYAPTGAAPATTTTAQSAFFRMNVLGYPPYPVLDGDLTGPVLGEAAKADDPPAGMRKIAETDTIPAGMRQIRPDEEAPWYKNWKILAAIAGGTVVLGGGAYYVLKD